jgi:hypothetical protein
VAVQRLTEGLLGVMLMDTKNEWVMDSILKELTIVKEV